MLIGILIGVLVGMALTALLVIRLMRTKMLVRYKSNRTFEETCKAVEDTVAAFKGEGWGFPIPKWHFYETFEKKGLSPKGIRNLMVYFVCNAAMAAKVIGADDKMTGIMPCSWAVYEMDDGNVYIAKMNVGLMAWMFSGVIRESMKMVEETDQRMMKTVL